jgi:SAM-dependent methyltransferase
VREKIKTLIQKLRGQTPADPVQSRIDYYMAHGRLPWSHGYLDYRNQVISKSLADQALMDKFVQGVLPDGFGQGLDERLVEYLWVFSKLTAQSGRLLDAGATFNYDFVLSAPLIGSFELCIQTFFPEEQHFPERRVSYQFGDLRHLIFKDGAFDTVVCQSTLEHIDMDMSVYGYQLPRASSPGQASYSFMEALAECERVLKPGGLLLITVPYGQWEDHGFFQQFDQAMIELINGYLRPKGSVHLDYFQYVNQGWKWSKESDCRTSRSYNPHTGEGKETDGAAHSRAVACLSFQKDT